MNASRTKEAGRASRQSMLVPLWPGLVLLVAMSACVKAPQAPNDPVNRVAVCATAEASADTRKQDKGKLDNELDIFDPVDLLAMQQALSVLEDPPVKRAMPRARPERPAKAVAEPVPVLSALPAIVPVAAHIEVIKAETVPVAQVDSVYFGENESAIAEPSPPLDALAALLEANPAGLVILEGHADLTELASSDLSQRRAERARAYLLRRGVPKHRVRVRSHGTRKPSSISTRQAGAQNRRVALLLQTEPS